MESSKKRLLASVLAVLATLCLTFGFVFGTSLRTQAEEAVQAGSGTTADDWDVTEGTGVEFREDGKVTMTGKTTLAYKEHLDLTKGYTMQFNLDEVYDFWEVTESEAEVNIVLTQGNARFDLITRTTGNGTEACDY